MAVNGEHDEDAERADGTGAAISGASWSGAVARDDAGAVLPSARVEAAEPVWDQSSTGPQGLSGTPRAGGEEAGAGGQGSRGSGSGGGGARASWHGVSVAASKRLGGGVCELAPGVMDVAAGDRGF